MSKTVVGIFEHENQAQDAQNYLLANGFGDGDVDIKVASYKSDSVEPQSEDADEDLFEKIGNFFRELFGDQDETARYHEAGKRGTIVTVHATSAEEAAAAARIMDSYGAMDVNKNRPDYHAGRQYEDPIVNPPSVAEAQTTSVNSVEARGVYLRSRIVDRPIEPGYRLRQSRNGVQDDAAELNKTIAERDALINEIVNNDEVKRDERTS